METKNNLEFYEQLRNVPTEAQKSFDNGRFKGTDINPMWRIKRMTEIFGPCGIGWYYEVVNRSLERSADSNIICAFIGINLYIKVNGEWSKPIYGEGGNTMCVWNRKYSCIDTSDEAYKMALTDAFSNATKQLGLGADIWYANDKNHSTKYDLQTERKKDNDAAPVETATPKASPEERLKACKTKKALRDLLVKEHWSGKKELVDLAKELSTNLPEE